VLTSHPTLLIGPSDWQPDVMPREEFARRLDALWRSAPGASRAIVYGDPRHHAELAYLTNLVPKLEAAVALISRSGAPLMFVGGGPNMLTASQPLTWIADVLPLRDMGKAIAKWLAESGGGGTVLIGSGYMQSALRKNVAEAVGDGAQDATALPWTLMARKSPHELAAIREACAALRAAVTAIGDAKRSGASVTTAILAGERAANAAGAQDVRTLFSVNGGRTLAPFETLIDQKSEPLQVYVAVRKFNYWAEGFAMFAERPQHAASMPIDVLRLARSAIRAGTRASDVAQLAEAAIRPLRWHPVTAGAFAGAVGLALDEPPYTNASGSFAAGEVYSLRIGVTDGSEQHAIASAMIAVRDDDNELLWSMEHAP